MHTHDTHSFQRRTQIGDRRHVYLHYLHHITGSKSYILTKKESAKKCLDISNIVPPPFESSIVKLIFIFQMTDVKNVLRHHRPSSHTKHGRCYPESNTPASLLLCAHLTTPAV